MDVTLGQHIEESKHNEDNKTKSTNSTEIELPNTQSTTTNDQTPTTTKTNTDFNHSIITDETVDLENPLQDWTSSECYASNYGICQIVLIPVFFFIIKFPAPIVGAVICMVWAMIICIISFIRYWTNKTTSNRSLFSYINQTLCIADTSSNDNIYILDRKYHGIFILLLSFHASFSWLICTTIYYDRFAERTECNEDDLSDNPQLIEQCMVFRSTSILMYLLVGMTALIALTSYNQVSQKCIKKIKDEKDKILKKYQHCASVESISSHLTG